MREYEQQYQDGLTTDKEKYNLVVDTWSGAPRAVRDSAAALSEPARAFRGDGVGGHDDLLQGRLANVGEPTAL